MPWTIADERSPVHSPMIILTSDDEIQSSSDEEVMIELTPSKSPAKRRASANESRGTSSKRPALAVVSSNTQRRLRGSGDSQDRENERPMRQRTLTAKARESGMWRE